MKCNANYRRNDLFCSGPNMHLNACIGTNGGPYSYHDFSYGYFSAAHHLVESIANEINPHLYIDVCVYPIVSNYRHALELALKHLIVECSRLGEQQVSLPTNHNLTNLWSLFLSLETNMKIQLIEHRDIIGKIITDFAATDPKGMVFRYPEDLQRRQLIDAFELLNIEVLYEAMKLCEYNFKEADIRLESVREGYLELDY